MSQSEPGTKRARAMTEAEYLQHLKKLMTNVNKLVTPLEKLYEGLDREQRRARVEDVTDIKEAKALSVLRKVADDMALCHMMDSNAFLGETKTVGDMMRRVETVLGNI